MDLGKSLKVALARKGMNQSQLARQMGTPLRTINKLANKPGGTVENINTLSDALGMKASDFVALGED